MQATTYEILQKIMKTELAEVSSEDVFDEVVYSQVEVKTFQLHIETTLSENPSKTTYYISDGNIVGSWEHFTGVFRLEESLVPQRESGWYRVKLHNAFYDNKKELVVYYDSPKEYFACGCDPFDENDFEWIDDEPIKFLEE
jgi:hypothetical protein